MSDNLRKDLSSKVGEAVKPDSQKTTGEKVKETVTGQADKLAGKAQPDNNKSGIQQLADSFQKGVDDAKSLDGKPLAETAGEYLESAKKYVNETIESFTHGADAQKAEQSSNVPK